MDSQRQSEGYADSEGSASASSQPLRSPSQSEAPQAAGSPEKKSGDENASSGTLRVRASRKRTKTGCLTCRKRRIKCGEERPTCNNCIKSKRVCEGYNQRVVFKDGMNGLLRPGSLAGGERRFTAQPYPNLQPAIAPQPAVYPHNGEPIIPLDTNLPAHIREHYAERVRRDGEPGYDQGRLNVTVPLGPLPSPHHGDFGSNFGDSPQREEHQQYGGYYQQPTPSSATTSSFTIRPTPGPNSAPNSASLFGPSTPYTPTHPPHDFGAPPPPPTPHQSVFATSNTGAGPSSTSCPFNPPLDSKYAMASQGGNQSEYNNNMFDPSNTLPPTSESTGGMGNPSQTPDDYEHPIPMGPDEFAVPSQETEIDYDQASEDDMDEEEDDGDYRFGTQEDGMIIIETNNNGPGKSGGTTSTRQQLSQVLEPFSRHLDEHSRISFRSFLPEPGVLASYHPTLSSSPLMNPITAKIFCHFVYVLGPSMSLFERYPPNPHIAFTPGAGLHGPQNVWSYTIPILSLSHPPLLHAILALSSLHISKLTKGPNHPSLLHYHIALRRLGKAIASDRHRAHVATLAATLMLAYYETMAAEHDKWSSHIHGAKQLLKEVDFDRVTKRVELLDDEEQMATQNSQGESLSPFAVAKPPSGVSLLAMRKMRRQMISGDADESLKSYLMGAKGGRRGGSSKSKKKESNAERPFSKKELEHLKLQADMFWWYAKMDCYQSLLSGCSLILDYVHWGQCPPRARIGTLGTTYGSSDHYFLLLGRLCDFQVRDLKRKRAVMKANGGQWIPPPEMGGPPRGHRRPPPPPPPNMQGGPQSSEPMQFGMVPPSAHPPRMPRAFAEAGIQDEPSLNTDPLSDESDLDTATAEAEHEWAEIEKAFMVLQETLGAEYQPLPIEYMPVHSTPFGPAIYYRTYSIASLQMLYNMAMLVLHRCHPSMPPVAMMATGIVARKTATYAVDIARIVAGLVPTDSSTQINPALGASLIEATMPMFFGAVQYMESEQREWIVKKLREINRLTGWATASRILLGCQRAWEKAAEMGRGPEYVRPPFEEEGELYYEYYNYHVAVQNEGRPAGSGGEADAGGEQGRFLWKQAGRRTVEATGILGEHDELGPMGGMGIAMSMGMGMEV